METLKKKLILWLDECNSLLSSYKELKNNGLSKDEKFEAVINTRKQVILEILNLTK